jgi:hypothetical protein
MSIFDEPFVDRKMKKICVHSSKRPFSYQKGPECDDDDIKCKDAEIKCKVPIQSGYYGLRFLDTLLTKKDINCNVTNDFKLANCSNDVIEDVNDVSVDLLKSYLFKQCNLGRYNNIPFYLFVLNKQFNCLNTFIQTEDDPSKLKFVRSLFTFIKEPSTQKEVLLGITATDNIVNKYIKALEDKFNKDKKNILIKPLDKTTKRPFLSSGLLRKILEENGPLLKHSKEFIKTFVNKVESWNNKKIQEYTLGSVFVATKERSILESSLEKKFVLAFDSKLPWINECLVIFIYQCIIIDHI